MSVVSRATLKGYFNVGDFPSESDFADFIDSIIHKLDVIGISNVNNTYVVQPTDEYVRCNGTFTVTLPPATGSGASYLIKNVGLGVITVDGDGADTIDGDSSVALASYDGSAFVDAVSGMWDKM